MNRKHCGYALLLVVFLTALLALALTAAAPILLTQGQRELEEELIFRGEQYKRAIGLYFRKNGRFPIKMEELLHTNGLSYLRKEWPDPMTPKGEWRIIRVTAGGQLVNSILSAPTAQTGVGSTGTASLSSSSIETLPIVGVASQSPAASFRVYNEQETYDTWEFVYNPQQDAARQGAAGAGSGARGGPGGAGRGGDRPQGPGGNQQRPPSSNRPPR